MKTLILGNGGHALVVADILSCADGTEPLAFACNRGVTDGEIMAGLPVINEDTVEAMQFDGMIVALGDNGQRKAVFERYAGQTMVAAIHPSAVISPDATIEPGCMVCAGVVVNPGAHIRANTILNTGCTVDHHCQVGPHAHVAPGVNLAGNVTVGEGAFMGIGSCAVQGVTIGDWAIVGAGAAVVEDIPAQTTAVGVPARSK